MAIRGNSFVWSVTGLSAFELGDAFLADQVAFDAVTGDKGNMLSSKLTKLKAKRLTLANAAMHYRKILKNLSQS